MLTNTKRTRSFLKSFACFTIAWPAFTFICIGIGDRTPLLEVVLTLPMTILLAFPAYIVALGPGLIYSVMLTTLSLWMGKHHPTGRSATLKRSLVLGGILGFSVPLLCGFGVGSLSESLCFALPGGVVGVVSSIPMMENWVAGGEGKVE